MRDRLYVHLVWTTRNREATIDLGVARFLERFLAAVARQERAGVHALGMVQTHVHLLLQLHPTTSIPRLLQRLKGGSSVLANREGHATQRPLRWAKGYSIASVSPRALEAVRAYVLSQPSHHPSEVIPGWQAAAVAPCIVGPLAAPFAAESRDSAERSREATPQVVTLSDR
ncbi:MAG TPA: IS200/IS605 family transposase [Gemmatimonadales bacterium]|nr:IS200/IS605 family transposase [Gemmatimonadales bacterium]